MRAYQNLIKEILADGIRTPNRTGVDTIKLDGAMLRFDLSKGFPATTSKKLAFKSVIGELCGFLRASRSAADFRALGCKVWDANANDAGQPGSPNAWLTNPFRQGEDDLGPVYGVQWRAWDGYKVLPCISGKEPKEVCERAEAIDAKLREEGWVSLGHVIKDGVESYVMHKSIDQLGDCVRKIIQDPNNRRILFHGWNPAVLDEVALPACHVLYQFLPDSVNQRLNMTLYQRSADVALGIPFNVAEASALVYLVARLTGLTPGRLTIFIGDAHVYVNSLDYLNELLTKEPLLLPSLLISDDVPTWNQIKGAHDDLESAVVDAIRWLKLVEPHHFTLVDYQHRTLVTPVPKMVV